LSKHFGAQDIFENVSLQIAHGERTALVGPNGVGKTTLLRILAGLEVASDGQMHRAKGLRDGYLPQEVTLADGGQTLWELAQGAFAHLERQAAALYRLEEAMAAAADPAERDQLLTRYGKAQDAFELAGGYTYENRIRQVLSGLGFGRGEYYRPLAQFSGGQQTRAHLARLLLDAPDLLLLDEPTNHLDLAAVEWLEDYLQGWEGAIVTTAHDRYFLDKVAIKVWDLNHGRLEVYRGNYTAYVGQRAGRRERQEREYKRQQSVIAKEEDFIRRNIAGQRTKEAQGRRKRLERLERIEKTANEKRISLNLHTDLRSGDLVLATHDLVVGYEPGATLFTSPDVEIRRGDCVALIGPNGAGKTAFVKTILKEVEPLSGRVRLGAAVQIGYLAQAHAGLDLKQTVINEVLSVPAGGRRTGKDLLVGEARNYLGRFLFSGDDVFKPISALSGGERSRVALAKLALRGASVPTALICPIERRDDWRILTSAHTTPTAAPGPRPSPAARVGPTARIHTSDSGRWQILKRRSKLPRLGLRSWGPRWRRRVTLRRLNNWRLWDGITRLPKRIWHDCLSSGQQWRRREHGQQVHHRNLAPTLWMLTI
jgi:ATP-binding cassette subfamily F protein 3